MITELQVKEMIEDKFSIEPYLDKLSEISKDDANRESLINGFDDYSFYNYDKIKESIYKADPPKSADMILFKNNEIVFVEFKNGIIDKKKRCESRVKDDECKYVEWDIKLKSIEGGLIILYEIASKEWEHITFSDIVNLKKTYILVYNEDKNPCKKTYLRTIHDSVSSYEIRYGLDIYMGTFFFEVHTFTKRIFLEWLEKNKLFVKLPDGYKKEKAR